MMHQPPQDYDREFEDFASFLRPELREMFIKNEIDYNDVSSEEFTPSPQPGAPHPVRAFSAQAIPPGFDANAARGRPAFPQPFPQRVRKQTPQQDFSFNENKLKALEDIDQFYPEECSNLLNYVDDFYDNYTRNPPQGEDQDTIELRRQLIALSSNFERESALHERQNPYLQEDFLNKVSSPTSHYDKESMLNNPAHLAQGIEPINKCIEESLKGFGEKRTDHWEPPQEDQNRKRRLCRHFLKGHCKRGRACDFLHDSSIFCPDLQKVFLGGLPAHITENTLRAKLAEQGYTVINKPKVLRGFTPQVCLGSIEEAQRLIEKGKINIDGSLVDVRPYEAFAKDNLDKKLPDDIKRSVFLGGLANGTTGQMIKDDLERLDVKVVNHPIIKTGFTPMVTLGTTEQAQMLVKLKKVRVNDTLVDVRPYVNFRKRY